MDIDPKIRASLVDICTRVSNYYKEPDKDIWVCRTKNYFVIVNLEKDIVHLRNLTSGEIVEISVKEIKDVQWISADIAKIKSEKGEILIEL